MPQPKKGPSLGSNPSHQRLMLSNLAQSLFEHERLKTTEAKAKLLRPFAERLITKAKDGSVHQRRRVLATIENRAVVHKLFTDIAPRFADRNGGYTRILKLGPRNGDGAPMALVELVEEAAVVPVEETTGKTGRRLSRPGRRRDKGLPQDKPARSRAALAGAAGAGLGVESAEEEGVTPETPEEAAAAADTGAQPEAEQAETETEAEAPAPEAEAPAPEPAAPTPEPAAPASEPEAPAGAEPAAEAPPAAGTPPAAEAAPAAEPEAAAGESGDAEPQA